MSPLWQALLQVSMAKGATPDDSARDSATHSSIGYLDFLYPTGAMSILHQYSSWAAHGLERRRIRAAFGNSRRRSYSNLATEDRPLEQYEDAINHTAGSLMKATPKNEAQSGASSADGGRASDSSAAPELTAFINTVRHGRMDDYEEAWRQYHLLKFDERRPLTGELILYMYSSSRQIDARRVLLLFPEIRDQATKDHYTALIKAHITLSSFEGAIEEHAFALRTFKEVVESDRLLGSLVSNKLWDDAYEVYSEITSHSLPQHGLWNHLQKLPNVAQRATEIHRYFYKVLKTSDQIRNFVASLLEATLLSQNALKQSGFSLLFRAYMDACSSLSLGRRHLQAVSSQVINNLLDDMQNRAALGIYKVVHRSQMTQVTRDTMTRLLPLFCKEQDVEGQDMILADWKEFYNSPMPSTYRIVIRAAARRGDAAKVHALWDEYKDLRQRRGYKLINPDFYNPLLDVHAKRCELTECLRVFEEIRAEIGTPSITHHNILLSAYGRVGDLEGAESLYTKMMESGQFDDYTIGTMMGICTRRGDYDSAVEIYETLDALGVRPSAAIVDCVVYSYIQKGQPQVAEVICKESLHKLLDEPKTRMWNYLLVHYANARDIGNIFRIHKEMVNAHVPFDGATYASLMLALCAGGLPHKAYKIMNSVMPLAGVCATEFHYAVVMGGFIKTQEWSKVIELHKNMMANPRHRSQPGVLTKLQTFKAALALDQKFLDGASSKELSKIAHDYYFRSLIEADPREMANKQVKGLSGGTAQDVVFQLAGFDYYIFIAGQNRAYERAVELAEMALSRVPDGRQLDVPLKLFSALMVAQYKAQDHDGLRKTWKLAFDVAKYQARTTSKSSAPISLKYKFALGKSLSTLIRSYSSQRKIDELKAAIADVESAGFSLDSDNWNLYVQALTKHDHQTEAFQICEQKLMPGWTGWSKVRGMLPRRNRLSTAQRRMKEDPRNLRPILHTALYLAKAYLEMEGAIVTGGVTYAKRFAMLEETCPKTLYMIRTMRREENDLERSVLGGAV